MKNILFGLCFCFFVLGCVRPKTERNISFEMAAVDYKELQIHCKEINSHGDIIELLAEIKLDVKEVLYLLQEPQKGSRSRISYLAGRIDEKSHKIRLLSKPEWTTERWNHDIQWKLDREDFQGIYDTVVVEASIMNVYFMGQKRDDLFQKINLTYTDDLVLINYRSMSSSLEICQLEKTLIVIIDIYTQISKIERHQFFSLNVQK